MSGTIEIPFAIGQRVWHTGYGRRETWIECPECCGTKVIEMVQGNGERVSLDCRACQSGYDPPLGMIKKVIYEHAPTIFVPRRVTSFHDNEIMYSESEPDATCYTQVYAKDLYESREECEARCVELNKERTEFQEKQILSGIESKRRDLAWSAHYWGRMVKDLERQLEAARARLSKCKQPRKQAATP